METDHIQIKGDTEALTALIDYAKQFGLEATSDELVQNTKKGSLALVVVLVGELATISVCVAKFQKEHKTQIEIVTPQGSIKSQNYTAEELHKLITSSRTNIFIRPGSP